MRAIFFDVDGVLVHGYHARAELRRCWDQNLVEDFGLNRKDFSENFIFKDFVNQVLIGKVELKDSLGKFLASLDSKIDPQTLIDYWNKKDANLNHELFEVIKKLKADPKIELYVATNQSHDRANYLMQSLGFNQYFLDIFHSAKVGVTKPDPAYFEYIHKTLDLDKYDQPAIFFDDTPKVVTAANEYGWEAYEFLDCGSLRSCEFLSGYL